MGQGIKEVQYKDDEGKSGELFSYKSPDPCYLKCHGYCSGRPNTVVSTSGESALLSFAEVALT